MNDRDEEDDDERYAALRAASRISGQDSTIATAVVMSAEITVMRDLLVKTLPGGDAEYWRLVREEIEG